MIRPYDTLILATTKLRTRRIRTTITVVLAGLLFGVLVAALAVAQGAVNSIHSFNQEGLNNRYIAQALPDPPLSAGILENKDVQARAQQIYDQMVNDKKAAAKRLGITYDPSTDLPPTVSVPGMNGSLSRSFLSLSSPSAQKAIAEAEATRPAPGMQELKQVAATYHPTGFYTSQYIGPSNGTIATMRQGVEDFDTGNGSMAPGKGQQPDLFQSGALQLADPHLTQPFMLPGASTPKDPTAVPLLIPYSQATTLLGLQALPKSASANERLARIRELYNKASGITFSACYRNTVSENQIQTAISQAQEIAKNAGNKDYQKPTLIYGLPAADSCGQATILSDTRSKDEKTLDAKQDEFTTEFGDIVTPVQQKIAFHVVGLIPDTQNGGSSTTIGGLLQGIVGSSLGGTVAIPADQFNAMPNANTLRSYLLPDPNSTGFGFSTQAYYVEFANADTARSFINTKGCTTRPDGTCATAAKPFQLSAFGSNSIALRDLQHKFAKFFRIAALVVVGLAVIILTGTIGRMIADGRRETAVFRATGAKRIDIALIYGWYTLLLSCIVALAALCLGLIVAVIFDHRCWQTTTIQAQLLFGASNIHRTFHFYGINVLQTGLVLLTAIAAGLVSMIAPIVRNVRRNPIKDMREE